MRGLNCPIIETESGTFRRKEACMYRFDSILIAVDDSEPSAWAVDAGAALAQQLHAGVVLVHVVNPGLAFAGELGVYAPEVLSDLRKQGDILLDDARDRVGPS